MKYLSDIIGEKQTALFSKYDVIFAFSDKQLEEGLAKVGRTREEMYNMDMGMFAPKEYADAFMEEHKHIVLDGVKEDVKLYGLDAIIARELANHEAYYTGDLESTFDALVLYDHANYERVLKVFNATKDEQD